LQNYDGYDYCSDAMRDLYDYVNMSSQMAKMFDKKGKYEKYPHFLMSKHMIISKNYRIMKEEHKEELFDNAYDGSLEYSNDKYAIIEPKSTGDIFKGVGRIYEAQFTNGTKITRDLIPCLDFNGRPCMFDKISRKTFYNQGTGEFLYG
jgi:hypothetical protein